MDKLWARSWRRNPSEARTDDHDFMTKSSPLYGMRKIKKKKILLGCLLVLLVTSLLLYVDVNQLKHDVVWFVRKTIWLRSLRPVKDYNFDTTKFPVLDANRCPPHGKLMMVRSIGRLGNQMSEYASLWVLSREHHRYPVIEDDMKFFLLQFFTGLSIKSLSELHFLDHCDLEWRRFILEQATRKDELATAAKDPNNTLDKVHIYLAGYPDTIPLYGNYLKEIQKEFTFHRKYIDEAESQLSVLRAEYSSHVFIFVHVRRTDYINVLSTFHNGTDFIGTRYFQTAMNYYRGKYPRRLFLVFSDDMGWCRENIPSVHSDVVFISQGDVQNPANDMLLMMSCDHAILTHGTFGFWAALLGPHSRGGEVLLAGNFTPIPTALEALVSVTPYLSKEWKVIPA